MKQKYCIRFFHTNGVLDEYIFMGEESTWRNISPVQQMQLAKGMLLGMGVNVREVTLVMTCTYGNPDTFKINPRNWY